MLTFLIHFFRKLGSPADDTPSVDAVKLYLEMRSSHSLSLPMHSNWKMRLEASSNVEI